MRFLDLDGEPPRPTERLDVSLSGRDHVLIGWPAQDAETTAAVVQALGEGDETTIDRLGRSGKLTDMMLRGRTPAMGIFPAAAYFGTRLSVKFLGRIGTAAELTNTKSATGGVVHRAGGWDLRTQEKPRIV